jgi:hypothetical protein
MDTSGLLLGDTPNIGCQETDISEVVLGDTCPEPRISAIGWVLDFSSHTWRIHPLAFVAVMKGNCRRLALHRWYGAMLAVFITRLHRVRKVMFVPTYEATTRATISSGLQVEVLITVATRILTTWGGTDRVAEAHRIFLGQAERHHAGSTTRDEVSDRSRE